MDPQIEIHGLDNRSLRSLLEHLNLKDSEYLRTYEPPNRVKRAIPPQTITFLFYSVTLLSALASWLALHGNEVDMGASVGLTNKFRWKIKPGKRDADVINKELKKTIDGLRASETQREASGKKSLSKKGVKQRAPRKAAAKTKAAPGKKSVPSKKTAGARKSGPRKKSR
jgi:hypothetical protein